MGIPSVAPIICGERGEAALGRRVTGPDAKPVGAGLAEDLVDARREDPAVMLGGLAQAPGHQEPERVARDTDERDLPGIRIDADHDEGVGQGAVDPDQEHVQSSAVRVRQRGRLGSQARFRGRRGARRQRDGWQGRDRRAATPGHRRYRPDHRSGQACRPTQSGSVAQRRASYWPYAGAAMVTWLPTRTAMTATRPATEPMRRIVGSSVSSGPRATRKASSDGDETPDQVDGDAGEQVLQPGRIEAQPQPELLETHGRCGTGDQPHSEQPRDHEERAAPPSSGVHLAETGEQERQEGGCERAMVRLGRLVGVVHRGSTLPSVMLVRATAGDRVPSDTDTTSQRGTTSSAPVCHRRPSAPAIGARPRQVVIRGRSGCV